MNHLYIDRLKKAAIDEHSCDAGINPPEPARRSEPGLLVPHIQEPRLLNRPAAPVKSAPYHNDKERGGTNAHSAKMHFGQVPL
jgi:hypothetical protein